MSKLTLEQAVAQADLIVDRPTIDKAIAGIADAIARDYKGETPVFISIMNGALPFAGQLALELGARGLVLVRPVRVPSGHALRRRHRRRAGMAPAPAIAAVRSPCAAGRRHPR